MLQEKLLQQKWKTLDYEVPDQVEGQRPSFAYGHAKRIFDMVFAAIVLVLMSPSFLMIAVLMKVLDPGPVFFGHRRIGRGGREFTCWKFRTMVPDAEKVLAEHLRENESARREWHETRKLKNDPRVTGLGSFLRTTSLDELPQFYNVLIGQMSVVGPRPVVDAELARYGDAAAHYLSVRPGVTGLWQVSGRNDVGYDQRVSLDRHYVEHSNLLLDLEIILRTFGVVFARQGSY